MSWIEKLIRKLKKKGVVIILVTAGIILSWIAATTDSFSKIVNFIENIFPKKPQIISFALDKTKTSFEETYEGVFGINTQSIRTFGFTPRSLRSPYPPNAIFYIAIKNESKKDLFINQIKFNVKKIGQVMGGEKAVLDPIIEDWFEIEWKENSILNNTPRHLKRVIRVEGQNAEAFNIGIYTREKEFGLCWIMNIEIITNLGSVFTEDFQLILSKSNTE